MEILIVLHSKELAGPSAAEAVRKVKQIGEHQFEAFTRERLVERTKTVDDTIPRNKLLVFGTSTVRKVSKPKQKIGLSQPGHGALFKIIHCLPDQRWKPR